MQHNYIINFSVIHLTMQEQMLPKTFQSYQDKSSYTLVEVNVFCFFVSSNNKTANSHQATTTSPGGLRDVILHLHLLFISYSSPIHLLFISYSYPIHILFISYSSRTTDRWTEPFLEMLSHLKIVQTPILSMPLYSAALNKQQYS